ncbi:uncharacterized protein [Dendrobates tinctorius]|uniref:uncharacterized protein n=1 Tax=Dendrobates tinctorius TaxID=92724 RepID=UPI003CCA0D8B
MLHKGSNGGPGPHDGLHPVCPLGPIPLAVVTKRNSREVGQESGVARQTPKTLRTSKGVPSLVVTGQEPSGGRALDNLSIRGSHHGRKCVGMGSPHRREDLPGEVASKHQGQILQFQGTLRGLGSVAEKPVGTKESSCSHFIRQYNDSGIPETPRRNQASTTTGTGGKDIHVGRTDSSIRDRGTSRGFPKRSGGLPEQTTDPPDRVGIEHRDLQPALSALGEPQYRSLRKPQELESSQILLPKSDGPSRGRRRPESDLGRIPLLCVPTTGPHTGSAQKDTRGPRKSDIDSAILAEEKLVFPSGSHGSRRSSRAALVGEHHPPGPDPPPGPSKTPSIGLDPERDILKAKGLSEQVISTLQASRKPVTSAIYRKIWKRFCLEGGRSGLVAGTPDLPNILGFLQAGFNKGLKPSTLKVQVSALSAFYDYQLAAHPWVIRFIKATQRLRPTIRQLTPPWDLGLVLRFLCSDTFALSEKIAIPALTRKTAFLVAITTAKRIGEIQALSTKEPYLQIREDSIILRLDPAFTPKVASTRNLNQEVVLPSFCDNPRNEKERRLHSLDVRHAVIEYLEATNSWRIDPNLFVLFGGRNKGKKASKASIARWITSVISDAYQAEGASPPDSLKAHSTRAVSASWAERAGASVDQICRVATWASLNTFCKHYKLDVLAGQQTAFGRKVLQAVIPP